MFAKVRDAEVGDGQSKTYSHVPTDLKTLKHSRSLPRKIVEADGHAILVLVSTLFRTRIGFGSTRSLISDREETAFDILELKLYTVLSFSIETNIHFFFKRSLLFLLSSQQFGPEMMLLHQKFTLTMSQV